MPDGERKEAPSEEVVTLAAKQDAIDGRLRALAVGLAAPGRGRGFGHQWPKGVSGNPAGNPTGSRNSAGVALDRMAAGECGDILQTVMNAAKAGDVRASEVVLSRVWPARKGRGLLLNLPTIKTAADVAEAMTVVTAAMAQAEVSPEEASAIASVLEMHRRSIETANLEERVIALEQADKPTVIDQP